MTITIDAAQALLAKDVSSAADCVNNLVEVTLTQEEFDALVDFVFNLGAGAFRGSTMLRDLNAGDFTSAAAQFDMWDHAGGAVVAGLLRRRQAEAELFEGGDASTQSA
jgi:lysozyme